MTDLSSEAGMTSAPTLVEQYSTELRLETRRSVWLPSRDGREPSTVALSYVLEAEPRDVLEVGCGTGTFAARLALALPSSRVTATDASPRMVELAAARGVEACVADIQALPFDGGSFDAVAGMWMLYHVPDLDTALAEVRRVLRPGGLFVAVTNGDRHLADLLREAGGVPTVTDFSSETGEEVLARHFEAVTRVDIETRALFADHAQAQSYLATFAPDLAARLPVFEGAREYAGATTVFTGRAPTA